MHSIPDGMNETWRSRNRSAMHGILEMRVVFGAGFPVCGPLQTGARSSRRCARIVRT